MSNVIQYKGYFANVEYSQEDQILFGKIEGNRLFSVRIFVPCDYVLTTN